jgi:hypothetical protein
VAALNEALDITMHLKPLVAHFEVGRSDINKCFFHPNGINYTVIVLKRELKMLTEKINTK